MDKSFGVLLAALGLTALWLYNTGRLQAVTEAIKSGTAGSLPLPIPSVQAPNAQTQQDLKRYGLPPETDPLAPGGPPLPPGDFAMTSYHPLNVVTRGYNRGS